MVARWRRYILVFMSNYPTTAPLSKGPLRCGILLTPKTQACHAPLILIRLPILHFSNRISLVQRNAVASHDRGRLSLRRVCMQKGRLHQLLHSLEGWCCRCHNSESLQNWHLPRDSLIGGCRLKVPLPMCFLVCSIGLRSEILIRVLLLAVR